MTFDSDADRRHQARRTRVLIAGLAIGVAWACLPFFPGLFGAAVLSVLGAPAYRRLAGWIGFRTSALLLTLLALLLIAAPALLLLGTAIQQAPGSLQRVLDSGAFARLSGLRLGSVDVGAEIAGVGRTVFAWASGRAVAAAGEVSQAILNLVIALIGFYYLLPAGPKVWLRVRRWIPGTASGTDHMAERFTSITRSAVISIGVTALSQGLTVGLAFVAMDLSNPLFWGVVTGMVSILPILGSALVWFPGVVVLFLDGRTGSALILGLIGVVVCSNVDNVIRPYIFRRVSGMHPMVSLLGAFAGVKAMGLVGVLVGPLVLTLCLDLFALHEAEFATDGGSTPSGTTNPRLSGGSTPG